MPVLELRMHEHGRKALATKLGEKFSNPKPEE